MHYPLVWVASSGLVLTAAVFMCALAQGAADSGASATHSSASARLKEFQCGPFLGQGPLVAEDIDVDSNNVKLIGRENFVNRIKRYSIPFPGL